MKENLNNILNDKDFSSKFDNLDLGLHGVRLPEFSIESSTKRHLSLSEDVSNYDFLRALALNGFKDLKIDKNLPEYKKYVDRAKYELETLKELGFIDYILLVWDVINFCKTQNIPVGLGRGSAAGSLILYLVGVTRIDPVKYNLYFERFISKIRAKKQVIDGITYLDGSLMCDVDLDICYYNRHKVLEYLEAKFKGKTSKILTLNTLSGKLLIKECGKIIGEKTEEEMTTISSLIPKIFGQVKDITTAYEEVSKFKEWCDENKEIYQIALKLRDLIKNKGVHPSGVLLSYDDLEKVCPTEFSSDKEPVSSFDMNWVSLFNIKLDILGLRSVSVVDDVCKNIGIKVEDIDLNDVSIYQNLQDLKSPHGLFQIEADTNFKVCQKVKPKNLEELSGVLALARPGALQFVDKYAKYTNTGDYEGIHPFFDDILKQTGGVALYQEQLMQMAHKIGFDLDEAEILRRIVGKKKIDEIKSWQKKIDVKIKQNKFPKEVGEILWKIMEDSANYSFNKSHSLAYAALAAVTIYLKFNYPQQFFLSLLKMSRNEPDPIGEISKIQKEMHEFNIELLPPHIIKSAMDFSIEEKDIRFGLLSIKGISDKSIEKLNSFRNKYSNKFEIFQAAEEADLNIGVLSALIQAGALSGFNQSRSKIVLEAQLWNILTSKEKRYIISFAEKFDYDLIKIIKHLNKFTDEKNHIVIKDNRLKTIKNKYEPYLQIYNQNSKSESFANWYYEKKLLGYTYNKSLKEIFSEKRENLKYISDIIEDPVNSKIAFVGQIEDVFTGVSKNEKKTRYVRLKISDETASMNVLIFNDNIENNKLLNNKAFEEGNIVIVKGLKKDDCIFGDLVAIQDQQIYMKLNDLKKIDKNN
ncbi:MAG: DNA polymerase III subunit alpha [Caulobacteraceae bacterium]|nr:DNA polymerase III subunit alpha [Caulobacteraceae bacterium]